MDFRYDTQKFDFLIPNAMSVVTRSGQLVVRGTLFDICRTNNEKHGRYYENRLSLDLFRVSLGINFNFKSFPR